MTGPPYAFGSRSTARLHTCNTRIQSACYDVIQVRDFTVIWGRRGQVAQDEAFATGHSSLPWPESKHNAIDPELSSAIDVAPWHATRPHIRWENEREFVFLAGLFQQAAARLGIVGWRWGGDWDGDGDLYDRNRPFDLGHFETAD